MMDSGVDVLAVVVFASLPAGRCSCTLIHIKFARPVRPYCSGESEFSHIVDCRYSSFGIVVVQRFQYYDFFGAYDNCRLGGL